MIAPKCGATNGCASRKDVRGGIVEADVSLHVFAEGPDHGDTLSCRGSVGRFVRGHQIAKRTHFDGWARTYCAIVLDGVRTVAGIRRAPPMNMSTVNDRRGGLFPRCRRDRRHSGLERWEIDPARSSLTFNLRHIVVQQIRGRFERWGGTLFIDRQQPWLSSVQVWVDLASVTTDDQERDAHVRSSEFLDVAQFPRAEFKSTNVDIPDGQVVVEGPVEPARHRPRRRDSRRRGDWRDDDGPDGRGRTFYTARAVIDRQSFGLHWNQDLDVGGIVVGDEVEIIAKVEASVGSVTPRQGGSGRHEQMSQDAFSPPNLPSGLEPLAELALDLRWTWSHHADDLWRTLDPEAWEATANPWLLLQGLPRERLVAVAADPNFRRDLDRILAVRREYLAAPPALDGGSGDLAHPVAYFCLEFGLGEAIPLYAGGLGVLAGDHLKAASDLGVPLVGIGLLYQEGYFRQAIDAAGRQEELYPYNDPVTLPIQPALAPSGEWLMVPVELPGRTLWLRAWRATIGRVTLYLLDGNVPINDPADRGIDRQALRRRSRDAAPAGDGARNRRLAFARRDGTRARCRAPQRRTRRLRDP